MGEGREAGRWPRIKRPSPLVTWSLHKENMASKVEFVKGKIGSNKVAVFSKTYCPFCKKAKEALKESGLKDYFLLELDEMDDGDAVQDALLQITGGRSVRLVRFIGKIHENSVQTKG